MCKLTPKFISTSTAKSPLKPIARSNGHIPTRSKQLMENSAKQKSVCQRLSHMRVSLSKLELRLLLEPLANLIKRFSRKPRARELVHESLINHLDSNNCRGNESCSCWQTASTSADACPDLFTSQICNKLLAKCQSQHNHKLACRAMVVFQRLVTRIGDALTRYSSDRAPLQSTRQNSENHPKVTEECAKTISVLREKFGFDLFDQDDQLVKARQKGKKRRHQNN
uniref:Uncharacterized protein n=1 Tax=Ditylenchus dipsaci TaxID=166011 RepID=A0A915DJS9_9BILA